jgi:hypothetical protein
MEHKFQMLSGPGQMFGFMDVQDLDKNYIILSQTLPAENMDLSLVFFNKIYQVKLNEVDFVLGHAVA